MNEAIVQEAARKNVQDIEDSHGGEAGTSGGVNEVKHDHRKSHGRSSMQGTGHVRETKSGQPAEGKKQCHRCGLTNHTKDNCRYEDTVFLFSMSRNRSFVI